MKKNGLFLLLILLICPIVCGTTLVYLQNIRFYTYSEYTRVVLDYSAPIDISENLLPGPDNKRIYFDMEKCLFVPGYPEDKKKEIVVKGGHLERIRIAQKDKCRMRVVFDFTTINRYTKFYLSSPFRVVFDVFRDAPHNEELTPSTHEEPPVTVTVMEPPQHIGNEYSIVRQLGLGVRTIVIDPGHGGKDPGTISNVLKIYEKNITLDIAKRLKKLFQKNNPQYNVILTREQDIYLSLEERTAIANSSNGDLFISIHLNSAPRKSVRGVETYYLSMTTDPWAIDVAAQENAMSSKSIGEMSTIVAQIVKYARISESKILTGFLQKHLVKCLKNNYKKTKNLGVKKAPFIVLAGAGMPAALVEVSFLSHPQEGKLIKSQNYRAALSVGLYNGIIAYINSLGKK